MSASCTNVDLSSLKDFQKDYHFPSKEGEVILSNHFRDFRKWTWHSHIPIMMSASQNNDITVYTCPENFHTLLYTYRVHKLPGIRVKEEFSEKIRICWPHNLGNNICQKAVLKVGGKEGPKLDPITQDICSQFFSKEGDSDALGNVTELESWSNVLPKYILKVFDPWFYSKDGSLALPLYFQVSFIHEYKFKQKIGDLLRMQELINDVWVNVNYNSKYVEISTNDEKFESPELWGRFDVFDGTQDTGELSYALNFWKDDDEGGQNGGKKDIEKTFYFDDFIDITSQNPLKMGDKIMATLESTKPVKAFYWVVENINNSKIKNLSNYTLGENVYSGLSPWTKYKYRYSSNTERATGEYYQASKVEPRFHSLSIPKDPGYGMYSYSVFPHGLDGEVGVVLSGLNAQLILDLEKDDPYSFPEDIQEEKEQGLFQLHVRLLVTRKMSFKYIKNSIPYRFEVTID